MDNAVSLVQAYLHVNGYFTVTEYPVIEAIRSGGYQAATDIDVLAFRFPGAGRLVPSRSAGTEALEPCPPDAELGGDPERSDMVIGEVKEGRAELNRGAREPSVLRVALARFGCCGPDDAGRIAEELVREGATVTPTGHAVRLVAFGSVAGDVSGYRTMTLGHVVRFLREYLREHWKVLHAAQFRHPGLGFLMTLEKALRGLNAPRGPLPPATGPERTIGEVER